jgi:iron complex transport system ATP-binding protein
MRALSARALGVSYDGSPALGDVALDVAAGSWLAVIGPNGAGKTTLLRALAALVPFTGDVAVAGAELRSLSRRGVAKRVALVPQRPHIPESMTVADYVLMGRTPHLGYLGRESARDLRKVSGVLETLELGALSRRVLGSLSGGEVQRVVIGRALAQEASVLLLDEPTASLDLGHGHHVLEAVDRLRHERGLTIVSAMHDLTLAGQFADDVVLVSAGRIVAAGSAREVLNETTLRRHYGASVRVLETPDGELIVIGRRSRGKAVPTAASESLRGPGQDGDRGAER